VVDVILLMMDDIDDLKEVDDDYKNDVDDEKYQLDLNVHATLF
jgi:hypothetical protein